MGSRLSCVALDGTANAEAMFEWPPNHYFAGRFTISADGKTRGAPFNNPPTGANIAIYEIGVIPSALSSGEKSFSCRRRSLGRNCCNQAFALIL
jgi:hypothetical protein